MVRVAPSIHRDYRRQAKAAAWRSACKARALWGSVTRCESRVPRAELTTRLLSAFAWHDGEADPSGWWRDPALLRDIIAALTELHAAAAPTVVIGIAARGTLLGPLVAQDLGVGFVEVRKYVKHQDEEPQSGLLRRTTPPDYEQRDLTLTIRKHLIKPCDRAILVDDWIETGAQANTAARLVEDTGGTFVGTAVIVDETTAALRHALHVRSLLSARQLP